MELRPICRNSSCGFFEHLTTTFIKASHTKEFKIKMNTYKMNIKSIIDFVTNDDISGISELSPDEVSVDEISMAVNVQEEYKSQSFDEEVSLSEITNILSLSTNKASKSLLKADIS